VPKASRRLKFSEMPGVSEALLFGAPTLSELGFGLSSDIMELRRFGFETSISSEKVPGW